MSQALSSLLSTCNGTLDDESRGFLRTCNGMRNDSGSFLSTCIGRDKVGTWTTVIKKSAKKEERCDDGNYNYCSYLCD